MQVAHDVSDGGMPGDLQRDADEAQDD